MRKQVFDDALQRLLGLGRHVEEQRAKVQGLRDQLTTQEEYLDKVEQEYAQAAREYGNPQSAASPKGGRAEPWKDDSLSIRVRVLKYAEAHPEDEITVAKLQRAGIDTSSENLHSTLAKLAKKGNLKRKTDDVGVYLFVFVKDQAEADAEVAEDESDDDEPTTTKKGGWHAGKGPRDKPHANADH